MWNRNRWLASVSGALALSLAGTGELAAGSVGVVSFRGEERAQVTETDFSAGPTIQTLPEQINALLPQEVAPGDQRLAGDYVSARVQTNDRGFEVEGQIDIRLSRIFRAGTQVETDGFASFGLELELAEPYDIRVTDVLAGGFLESSRIRLEVFGILNVFYAETVNFGVAFNDAGEERTASQQFSSSFDPTGLFGTPRPIPGAGGRLEFDDLIPIEFRLDPGRYRLLAQVDPASTDLFGESAGELAFRVSGRAVGGGPVAVPTPGAFGAGLVLMGLGLARRRRA